MTEGLPYLVDFDPLALRLGPLAVHWYGVMYLLAFAAFWWLGRRRAARGLGPLKPPEVEDLLFYCVLGVILGGRLGYMLFYGWAQLVADPLSLFRIWEGGMSFHGGLLGVIAAMAWYGRRHGAGFWPIADFVAPLVPIGLMFGRLGNFINGELWGRLTDAPWGMIFPSAIEPSIADRAQLLSLYAAGALNDQARHPSPLYQASLEGLLLFVLLYGYSRRPRRKMAVSGWFLTGYATLRMFAELYRVPDAHIGYLAFDWLTMGQVLSLPMLVAGLVLLYLSRSQPVAG